MSFDGNDKCAATPAKRLIATAIVVCVGFCAICWSVLVQIGERDREVARVNAANLIAAIGSEISRNIELFDLSLQAAADGMQMETIYLVPEPMRQMILFDRSATAHGLGTIMVLDKFGNVVVESRASVTGRSNYSDRDYFQVHESNPASGRYVTTPWKTRRGEYVIGISRRLNDGEGNFAGVVIGTMKLDYLRGLLERVQRSDSTDSLTLIRENGTAIMRAPFDESFIGRSVAGTRIFQKYGKGEKGTFEEVAFLDGIRRMYTFERVVGLPFILSYGVSVDGLYADWSATAWRLGFIVLCLCAVNLALVAFLVSSLKKRGEAEAKLEVMATTDALTGLRNRRQFDQDIELEWNRARRSDSSLSLLMIDADRFKDFNDAFGHQAGDTALAAIADCIARSTRRADEYGARYGGEEFAVVLPGRDAAEAMQVAQAIRAQVAALRADQALEQADRLDITPTVSIGVATLTPQAGLSTRDLVKAADAALYQAKRDGRDRAVAAPSQLNLLARKMAA